MTGDSLIKGFVNKQRDEDWLPDTSKQSQAYDDTNILKTNNGQKTVRLAVSMISTFTY